MSSNLSLPWSIDLYNSFKYKWDWASLSSNVGLPWTEGFVEEFKTEIDFKSFSRNRKFCWSEEFIECYKDKLDWVSLSENPSLNWTEKLVLKYQNKWNFNYLSFNKGVCWNVFLIDKFKDKLNWMGLSSKFKFNNIELINNYKKEISWENISSNDEINYTPELLKTFAYNWVWYPISGPSGFGEGLSGNYGVFSSLLKNLSINDIELFLKDYLVDLNNNNDESYIAIHRNQINEMSLYDSFQEDNSEEIYDPLKDNPNYDSESDLDQQSPYFDF